GCCRDWSSDVCSSDLGPRSLAKTYRPRRVGFAPNELDSPAFAGVVFAILGAGAEFGPQTVTDIPIRATLASGPARLNGRRRGRGRWRTLPGYASARSARRRYWPSACTRQTPLRDHPAAHPPARRAEVVPPVPLRPDLRDRHCPPRRT